jgi:arsenite methyltransferase
MTETNVPDDQKRRVVADFNAMVETYDALRFVQVCARRLVELAALPPGAQVSDIATGTGWAAIAAAQHVGPTGRVLGVDLAPELLERARQKAAAAGLTQVEFREGDAERLDLGDQRFDVVLCASALFFVPDMLAALREWYRVLTPGGQVGFSGFGPTFGQAPARLVGCTPAAAWGVRAHGVTGPAPGRAGDVSAVAARGRLCAD